MILCKLLKKSRQIELRTNRLVKTLPDSVPPFSLAPGFSPVLWVGERSNRFIGFRPAPKPLKRLDQHCSIHTGLKPGASDKRTVQP